MKRQGDTNRPQAVKAEFDADFDATAHGGSVLVEKTLRALDVRRFVAKYLPARAATAAAGGYSIQDVVGALVSALLAGRRGIGAVEFVRRDALLREVFGLGAGAPSGSTTYRALCELAGLEERSLANCDEASEPARASLDMLGQERQASRLRRVGRDGKQALRWQTLMLGPVVISEQLHEGNVDEGRSTPRLFARAREVVRELAGSRPPVPAPARGLPAHRGPAPRPPPCFPFATGPLHTSKARPNALFSAPSSQAPTLERGRPAHNFSPLGYPRPSPARQTPRRAWVEGSQPLEETVASGGQGVQNQPRSDSFETTHDSADRGAFSAGDSRELGGCDGR